MNNNLSPADYFNRIDQRAEFVESKPFEGTPDLYELKAGQQVKLIGVIRNQKDISILFEDEREDWYTLDIDEVPKYVQFADEPNLFKGGQHGGHTS